MYQENFEGGFTHQSSWLVQIQTTSSTDITDIEDDHFQILPDDTNDNNNQSILANKMSQLQRRRNALTEEEKLPSYLQKQLNANPQHWKFWSQISSEVKKKIVKCIPPDKPQGNLQVMQGVFQSLLH